MWKIIDQYASIYEINEIGTVRRVDNKKVIKLGKNNRNYLQVFLRKPNGQRKHFYVHRLVAIYFIPNPNSLPCVNHKDGNKLNNCVNNLEWCTYSQNSQHAWDNGLIPRYKSESAKQKMRTSQQLYRARQHEAKAKEYLGK